MLKKSYFRFSMKHLGQPDKGAAGSDDPQENPAQELIIRISILINMHRR